MATPGFKKVKGALEKKKFLLLSDAALPCVSTMLTGERIKGSWWGHPKGNAIFNVSCALDDDPEVLVLKLINGKVTFVHASVWPLVLQALKGWEKRLVYKTGSLEQKVRDALVDVESIRVDELSKQLDVETKVLTRSIGSLEKVGAFYTHQVHAETGKHLRVLSNWDALCKDRRIKSGRFTANSWKQVRDLAVEGFECGVDAIKLPWSSVL